MHPLSDHHLVFLAVSIALPAGVGLGLLVAQLGVRRPAGIALALFVTAFVAAAFVKQRNEIAGAVTREPPEIAWAVRATAHSTTRPGRPRRLGPADRPLSRAPPDAGPADRHVDRPDRRRGSAARGRPPV